MIPIRHILLMQLLAISCYDFWDVFFGPCAATEEPAMPQTALPMNPGKLLKMGSGPMELSNLVVAALDMGGSFFS